MRIQAGHELHLRVPSGRGTFLVINVAPQKSGREKQRRSRWKKGRARYKAKFESAILIRTATLIGESN